MVGCVGLYRFTVHQLELQIGWTMASNLMEHHHQSLVLDNPDLLEYIFSNHIRRRDLLSAGLTSKTFWEPAVTQLWHNMESIWPLFRVLPVLGKRKDGEHVSVFFIVMRGEERHQFIYHRFSLALLASNTSSASSSMPVA